MRYFACVCALFTLTSCLLKQTDPTTTLPPRPYLLGAASVEDLIVSNQGELVVFNAEFAIKPPSKSAPTPVASTLASVEGRRQAVRGLLESPSSRAASCRKVKLNKETSVVKEGSPQPTPLARVNVGKLGFGPALQPSLVMVESTDKNVYQTALQPGLPAGAYVVVGDGNGDVDPFNEILSMPEDVHHFRINGRDFGDLLIEFEPAQDLQLFWKDPAIGNDQNGILMEVITEDTDSVYVMSCALREDDIPSVSGFKNWNLDANWFAEFPRSGKADFYFIRAHQRLSETKRSKVQLQGARTFYSRLDIKP